jgi:hypothetical protein
MRVSLSVCVTEENFLGEPTGVGLCLPLICADQVNLAPRSSLATPDKR